MPRNGERITPAGGFLEAAHSWATDLEKDSGHLVQITITKVTGRLRWNVRARLCEVTSGKLRSVVLQEQIEFPNGNKQTLEGAVFSAVHSLAQSYAVQKALSDDSSGGTHPGETGSETSVKVP